MGRSAAGVIGMKLRSGDAVVGSAVIPDGEKYFTPQAGFPDAIVVLENGFGKRTMIKNFNLQNRGGIGIKAANCTARTGNLVGMEMIYDDLGDALLASKNGQFIRMAVRDIKRLGRDTQGVTLMKMRKDDKVSSLTIIRPEKEKNTELGIVNHGEERKPKKEISTPKPHNSEFKIHDSKKAKESAPKKEDAKIEKSTTKKTELHNSLLRKPDDLPPTIRAYNPRVDQEIKKTLKDDGLGKKRFDDKNWWGQQ